jgi:hypothetical protein
MENFIAKVRETEVNGRKEKSVVYIEKCRLSVISLFGPTFDH